MAVKVAGGCEQVRSKEEGEPFGISGKVVKRTPAETIGGTG